MKTNQALTFLSSLSLLALSSVSSPALVVVLSDLVPAGSGGSIETFLNTDFWNVTEVRHANYANFSATTTQDALNGTGAFAGDGAADVVIIGRSISSGDYDAGDADGYNGLLIPVVNFTSYTARQNGDRMGWHASSTSTDKPVAGAETTVTSAGAAILGLSAGPHDLVSTPNGKFNGLGEGSGAYGDGSILATIGGDTLAAYWAAGDAPGNTAAAGVATFPAARLLFNLDNEPNAGNNGVNDLNNLTPAGRQSLAFAIEYATPLDAVPDGGTTVALLGVALLGLGGAKRRFVRV